jgi:hypothetical protein
LPRSSPGFVLPSYVLRPHDKELRQRLRAIAAGQRSELVVLRGGSCVGKTRAAYEAVQACLADWQLLYPKTADAVAAACDEVGPSTVVWLDNAHQLLAEPAGESAATALRRLLERPGPGVVIATMWSDRYAALVTQPTKAEGPDPHRQARELLRSSWPLDVPQEFDGAAMTELRRTARTGPALRVALESVAQPGAIAQTIAAGPDLLDRWTAASNPYAKAVLTAAIDARRLGVRSPLSAALLRAAAPGYLGAHERAQAPADWFEQAVAYGLEPVKSVASALLPVADSDGMGARPGVFALADYLEQHAAAQRFGHMPPQAFWQAAGKYLDSAGDLEHLGTCAFSTGRYRWGRQLLVRAAEEGYAPAVESLCHAYTEVGRILIPQAREELIGLARSVDDGGYSLWDVGTTLAAIATEPGSPGELLVTAGDLLNEAVGAGYFDAVYPLAGLIEHVGLDATALVRDVEHRRKAALGRPSQNLPAEAALLNAAIHADALALAALTRLVDDQGPGFHALVRCAVADPHLLSMAGALRMRKPGGSRIFEALVRAVAATGAPGALLDLAGLLSSTGREKEAEEILEAASARGDDNALVTLCAQLWDSDPSKAEALLRQARRDYRPAAVLRSVRSAMKQPHPARRSFAEEMMRQLASDGYAPAQYQLAEILLDRWQDRPEALSGTGVRAGEVPAEVIALLEAAAPKIADACRLLGQAAESRHDLPCAEDWYRRATDAGDYQSLPLLAQVLYPASPDQQDHLICMGLEPDGTVSPPW